MERKTIGFAIESTNQETGIIEGYAATFSTKPDSYGDIIEPGAFTKTLQENKDSIVSLFNHNVMEPIGLPELRVDSKGLYTRIRLVMELQKARDMLALARAGVVRKMSIGYDTIKSEFIGGVRHLREVRLYDVSPVVFAANPEARITLVKGATTFHDLPLANRDRGWDATEAITRVRAWAGGEDINWVKYRQAFMYYEEEEPELFGSYKLPFADVLGGALKAVPRAVFAIAAVLMGARGGVHIAAADAAKVRLHVERYYAKMRKEFEDEGIVAPWKKSDEIEGMEQKIGRVLSEASLTKIRAALQALQALLEAAEWEKEPEKSTPYPDGAYEAAQLDTVIAGLKAENEGFDTKEAEARIKAILAKIKQ